jgi:hypothetical protein
MLSSPVASSSFSSTVSSSSASTATPASTRSCNRVHDHYHHHQLAAVTFILCGERVTLSTNHFAEQQRVVFTSKPSTTTDVVDSGAITVPPLAVMMSNGRSGGASPQYGRDGHRRLADVVFGLDVSQAFAVAHRFGITPLLLQLRDVHDTEPPLILIPHPETKRVSIHDQATYELGALVGPTLVRLTASVVSDLRRRDAIRCAEQKGGGSLPGQPLRANRQEPQVVCDEMTYRLWRAFLAFHRRVLRATDPNAVDAGIAAGLRIGAKLLQHRDEFNSIRMQAVQKIAAFMADDAPQGIHTPNAVVVVDHPWLRPIIQQRRLRIDDDDDEPSDV